MSTGSDGLFRRILEGCIAASDTDIARRPYHRNCSCALHGLQGCSKASAPHNARLSFPMRRSLSAGNLCVHRLLADAAPPRAVVVVAETAAAMGCDGSGEEA
ncbi:hypothetical protein QJS04_geneDACA003780 [Acorus gramineus]|uniref:Uncharacterized protein n=1 Tax=Acorus gramineus TaxID=55184 RepID=A0AAV9BGD3_ACOGR|nr:hypothetical protein QJS04_geneDACA003780 [Acorus gramineus]